MFRRFRSLLLVAVAVLLGALFLCAMILPGFALAAPYDLRFVDETGAPLGNAELRILCYTSANATEPTADLLFTTDATGALEQQLPPDCAQLGALQVIQRQPSGKAGRDDAYWVYSTSWQPGSRNLSPASGAIAIHSDWRLVLFDVAVALEWQPAPESPYVEELRAGLLAASGYLYDLTDGQMAFGPLTIDSGGAGWEGADIQVRAANDYRPAAQVGGLVAQRTRYTTPAGMATEYAPAHIVLGRFWDGFDAADPSAGAWTMPAAYRTLIHEWLHYALFLYDEYQEATPAGRAAQYCTCTDLPLVGQDAQACGQIGLELAASAMSYHYTAGELWLDGLPAACRATDQQTMHGEADWATLERWSQIQGLADEWLRKPVQATAGPGLGLAADLFDRRPARAATTGASLYLPLIQAGAGAHRLRGVDEAPAFQSTRAVTLNVAISASLALTDLNALHVQVYTLEPATAVTPARIVYQGETTGPRRPPDKVGQIALLGVPPVAQVWVAVESPTLRGKQQGRFVFAGDLNPDLIVQSALAQPEPCCLTLDVQPGAEEASFRALTLTLTTLLPLTTTPSVQLCSPAGAVGCPDDPAWRRTMASSGPLSYTTTFSAPTGLELPALGALRVSVPGHADILRWFQALGGVGPGHRWAHAPMREGWLTVDATTPLSGVESLALIAPTFSDEALTAPLPPGIAGLLNLPLDVAVVLPDDPQPADNILPDPVVLTFYFGRETLNRLALTPASAQLLHYRPAARQWEVLAFSGRSPELDWLASQPITETGIFAVGRAAAPGFGAVPQMYADPGPLYLEEPLRYLVVMPANPTLITPTLGFVQNPLPPIALGAQNLHCNIGACAYDAMARTIGWQGNLNPGDLLIFSFDIHLDPTTPPSMLPPTFVNQANAYDGVMSVNLAATTALQTAGRKTMNGR